MQMIESKKDVNNIKSSILQVREDRCPQNHACPAVHVCPVDALTQDGFRAPTVDIEKCIKCGKCTRFCPMKALVLE